MYICRDIQKLFWEKAMSYGNYFGFLWNSSNVQARQNDLYSHQTDGVFGQLDLVNCLKQEHTTHKWHGKSCSPALGTFYLCRYLLHMVTAGRSLCWLPSCFILQDMAHVGANLWTSPCSCPFNNSLICSREQVINVQLRVLKKHPLLISA